MVKIARIVGFNVSGWAEPTVKIASEMWKCLWLPFKKWTGVGTQSPRLHAAQNFKRERSSQLKNWTKLTWPKKNTTPEFDSDFPEPAIDWIEIVACKTLQKVWLGLVTWSHLRPILTFDSQLSKKSTHGLDLRQFRRRVALAGLNVGSLLVGGAWWCQSVKARNHFWRLTSHCISCSRKSQIWKFWQISSETSFTLRHCCSTAALSLGQQPVSLWQLHRVQLFSLKITSFWLQNVFTVSRRQLKWIKCDVKSAPRPI